MNRKGIDRLFRGRIIAAVAAATVMWHEPGEPQALTGNRANENVVAQSAEDLPADLRQLVRLGDLLYARNRFNEARRRYSDALAALESAASSRDDWIARVSLKLGNALRKLGHYTEAEESYHRALSILSSQEGDGDSALAEVMNNLGLLYHMTDRFAQAETHLRKALAINEKIYGPKSFHIGINLHNLARLLTDTNKYAKAHEAFGRALAVFHAELAEDDPRIAALRVDRGRLYQLEARFDLALRDFELALETFTKQGESSGYRLADTLNNLALVQRRIDRPIEAEQAFLRAIEIYDRVLGPEHPFTAIAMTNLAKLFSSQGRYSESEALYKRSIEAFELVHGPDHRYVSSALTLLAEVYGETGRLSDAEMAVQRSVRIREKLFGSDHYRVGQALAQLADVFEKEGRYAEAESTYRRALTAYRHSLGANHPLTAIGLAELAAIVARKGQIEEAENYYREVLATRNEIFDEGHPLVAESYKSLATVLARKGHLAEALAAIGRSIEIVDARLSKFQSRQLGDVRREKDLVREIVLQQLRIAAETNAQAGAWTLSPNSFRAIQLARITSTAAAISRMAARLSSGGSELAELVSDRKEALSARRQLDSFLLESLSKPPAQRNFASEHRVRAESKDLNSQIQEVDEKLNRDFSEYLELADPRPVSLSEVRRLLAPDEAMLVYLLDQDQSYLQVVRHDSAAMLTLVPGEALANHWVGMLRLGLDQATVDDPRRLKHFDLGLAHEAYEGFFAPAEPLLSDVRHLFLVLDGGLQSLPMGVLVRTPLPSVDHTFSAYRNVDWLARNFALSVLPSVGSLRALRQVAKQSEAAKPFIGFGDPLLEGPVRSTRAAGAAALFDRRTGLANLERVRNLPRLPETADELYGVARALKAQTKFVYLGKDASETTIRSLALQDFKVLGFATHGVVAGDFRGKVTEPALVLNPPLTASESDDGLLTASEIATLKLDADWVVLSACNTATPSGTPDADGLSGLAKSFFYAGTRSLLVSHWEVFSQATVHLVTSIFEEIANDSKIRRSEALRRARMSLLNQTEQPFLKHPAVWAPFVLIGESGPLGETAH